MFIHSNAGVVFMGFIVSLWLIPRASTPDYLSKFLGYSFAVVLLLTATSEIMIAPPLPFYVMLGSGVTLIYAIFVLVKQIIRLNRDNQ